MEPLVARIGSEVADYEPVMTVRYPHDVACIDRVRDDRDLIQSRDSSLGHHGASKWRDRSESRIPQEMGPQRPESTHPARNLAGVAPQHDRQSE